MDEASTLIALGPEGQQIDLACLVENDVSQIAPSDDRSVGDFDQVAGDEYWAGLNLKFCRASADVAEWELQIPDIAALTTGFQSNRQGPLLGHGPRVQVAYL